MDEIFFTFSLISPTSEMNKKNGEKPFFCIHFLASKLTDTNIYFSIFQYINQFGGNNDVSIDHMLLKLSIKCETKWDIFVQYLQVVITFEFVTLF